MNKTRLENLTDGVFAIVMTLLVIEIRVPETQGPLLESLRELTPLFVSYFLSFAVLSAFWLSHHGFFHLLIKSINRQLIQLNILYLSFVSLIPFSAHVLGSHPYDQVAVMWYGVNIILVVTALLIMLIYAIRSPEVENEHVGKRLYWQAGIRNGLTLSMALLGIAVSYHSTHLAIFLYLIPTIFNAIPNSLNFLLRILRIRLPE